MSKKPKHLRERCEEILEWKDTGLLRDGELRKLAASLSHVPESLKLSVAENMTATEAMKFIVKGAYAV